MAGRRSLFTGILMRMQYSKSGLDLTKSFESCALMPYLDINGIPTDGWGNTHNVVMGTPITQEKADSDLLRNCQEAVDAVNTHVTVPLTQGEFDALVDFTVNCGVTAFIKSTMLRLLNRGDYVGAAGQFELWDHASGKVVAGLLRRRVGILAQAYASAIAQPVSYTSVGKVTKTYQADPASIGNLQNMLLAYSGAQATPAGFYWIAADNTQVPFTFADLQGLAAAMGAQGFTAFAHLQTQKTLVLAATTTAAVTAIGW